MNALTRPVRRLLTHAQRRFVRSRAGSVLILVVALLVLMALIGTAFMTMAQSERGSAVQHTFNTEVDLLLDGLIALTKGTVTSDLFVQGNFRPATGNPSYNSGQPNTYNYWNSLGLSQIAGGNPGDWWLSSRIPSLQDDTLSVSATNVPLWRYVTGPLNGGSKFDQPYWPTGTPVNCPIRANLIPMEYRIQPPASGTAVQIDGQYRPGFFDPNSNQWYMAADTDGDGMADAGMFKLLALDGITYYGAVRIVDNCAAINANIALRPNRTTALTALNAPASAAMPGDLSPVNIDLEGLVVNPLGPGVAPTDLYGGAPGTTGLFQYRTNNYATGPEPVQDTATGNGTARTDFYFMGYPETVGSGSINFYYDQQWTQLGRRLSNPGFLGIQVGSAPTGLRFQALPISDSLSMARDFILRDSSISSATASTSIIEQCMPNSTFNAPSTPYAPSATVKWFTNNFDFLSAYPPPSSPTTPVNNRLPIRSILTAFNPVSNFVPCKFTPKTTGPYNIGDVISVSGATGLPHRYVCIRPHAAAAPISPDTDPRYTDPNWAFEPWTTAPTKTSVNTATFQQLFAAYWSVMCESPNVPPYNTPDPTNSNSRMFRNPIRAAKAGSPPASGIVLTPLQVLYLRAAIAAVNTMDLRDADDDVTSRTILLPDTAGNPVYVANVYGIERQPYITHVYARNDDTDPNKDFMAVELYNPYSKAIPMQNWQFATLDRTNMTMTGLGAIPGVTQLDPYQRLVLVSGAPDPMAVNLGTVKTTTYSGLLKAFGNELFLMRPRRADGTLTKAGNTPDTFNWYDEKQAISSPALACYMVPVDSYDFTNLVAKAAAMGQDEEWEYVRPNEDAQAPGPTAGKAWHFVYPSRWGESPPATPPASPPASSKGPTEEGTDWGLVSQHVTPAVRDLTSFGSPYAKPPFHSDLYQDVTLQLNNTDFGGPLKATAPPGAPGNYYPFGSFARNGDILQTTFIGSYMIAKYNASNTAATAPTQILEVNAATMDSAMATARDSTDAKPYQPESNGTVLAENIGRFCPVRGADAGDATIDDFSATATAWRYHWAMRIFDYLTVQSPQDDYLPDVDPWLADIGYGPGATWRRYQPSNTAGTPPPQATANVINGVKNSGLDPSTGSLTFNANNATEETAGVHGLININTAPWRVLATIPWVSPANYATGYWSRNKDIAIAIAKYRDFDDGSGANPPHGHGPFKSIFELNRVQVPATPPTVAPGDGSLRDILKPVDSTDFTAAEGNLSPLPAPGGTPASDYVQGDFESRFNTITRVSNLITTRSDSYTAYILIQGWRNAETANPHLVVQRRAAIILDRSTVTPANRTPGTVNVPMD